MSAVDEVALTAARELRRNLRSTKGIVLTLLFVLGGALPSFLGLLLQRFVGGGAGPERLSEANRTALQQFYRQTFDGNDATAAYLVHCPPSVFLFYWSTLWVLPFLILMIGFDQLAGEVQHRTLRYVAGRAARPSLVCGKALGHWALIAVLVFTLFAVVGVLRVAQGSVTVAEYASWGGRFYLYTVAYAAAYVGLTALASALVRVPIIALFGGFAAIVVMGIAGLVLGLFDAAKQARWVLPSQYKQLLASPDPATVALGAAALVLWGAACVAGAAEVLKRRDL